MFKIRNKEGEAKKQKSLLLCGIEKTRPAQIPPREHLVSDT